MEVKLHETENPWKPARLRGSQADRDKTEDLYDKVRGVLNKLTPQKLHTLVHQIWILPVDCSDQLHGIVNLVFDKAIAEPRYSVVYAQMCKMLSNMRAVGSSKEGQPEKFRKLLLNRCRHEFENPQADLKREEHLEEIERCTDPEKKKELQSEFEEMERQLRMKSVGFIRFVGELFKLGVLTSNVLHRYIQRLLMRRDEVSLECLCELLTITGKHIETTDGEKEKGKEKGEKEKHEREEEVEGEKNKKLELIAVPNKVNAHLPAAALEEKKEDDIIENFPSEPVLCIPKQMYGEDQWSPFNPDGKKKYERDFLIKVKDTREAKRKPEIRPDVLNFVLKDKVNRLRLPDLSRGPHENFAPAFTKSQSLQGDLAKYFEEMKVLSKQRGQISSRVRFMLQDVIELRDNKWVPRRQASVLETVDEIQHEAMCESVEMQMPFRGGSTGHSGVRGHAERGGDWRKRGGLSKDGWQSVQRKNLDTSKFRIKVSDLINISLGGSNQFAAWTQGGVGDDSDSDCSSAYSQRRNTSADLQDAEDRIGQLYGIRTHSSSTERAKASNTQSNFACGGHRKDDEESLKKYCYLDNSKLRIKVSDLTNISLHENDRFATWTRGDGGNSASPQTRKPFADLHDIKDKKSGVGMFSRPYGKQPPPSNAAGEKAVNTLRNFVLAEKEERRAQIASSGTPSRSTSHDDSSARQTSSSLSSQSCNGLAAAAQPVASISYAISDRDTRENLPHLSPKQVAKKVQFILEEFVNNNNLLESAVLVSETFPPSNMGSFVTEMINVSLERSAPIRSSVGKLMGHLMREGILTTEQFLEGFKEIAEVSHDLVIDVPKVWLYLAEILVPVLSTEALSFLDLKTAATGLHELLVKILRLLVKEKGPRWIRQRWDVAGISWEDFAPAHLIDRIVKENKLEFTVGPVDEMAQLTSEVIHTKLLQMLRPEQGAPATTDEVSEWISTNVGDRAKTPEFIRVLTTAVCESAYQASSSKKFEEASFSKHATLLQKYIDTNEERELRCLYAVQELNHRLEQPSGLLCSLFQALWDFGCVANETFLKWQQSRDPAFLQGKGIALKSLTAFFTALREADDDSSEDCASGQ